MRITPMIVRGVFLVVLATAALVSEERFYDKPEMVVENGSFTVTADKQQTVPLPPIFGGIGMAPGAKMIAVGARKKYLKNSKANDTNPGTGEKHGTEESLVGEPRSGTQRVGRENPASQSQG